MVVGFCCAWLENTDSTGGDVDRLDTKDIALTHVNLETEPVRAEEASGSVKGDGGGDLAFEIVAGAGQQALSNVLCPSHATDQGIVQEVSSKRDGQCGLAHLQQLKQNGNFGQVRDNNSGIVGGEPFQLDMQLG